MTVSELIEELKVYNSESDVYIYTGDINLMEIDEIKQEAPSIVVIS